MPTTSSNFKSATQIGRLTDATPCPRVIREQQQLRDSSITSQGTNPCRRMPFYDSTQDKFILQNHSDINKF